MSRTSLPARLWQPVNSLDRRPERRVFALLIALTDDYGV
jgi:hypothetical protein